MRKELLLLAVMVAVLPTLAFGHSGRTNAQGCHNDNKHGGYHCHGTSSGASHTSQHRTTTGSDVLSSQVHATEHYHSATGVARDEQGHIKRSSAARGEFMRAHPCPSTGKTSGSCPGYVVDHRIPLKRGGADDPSNMQWQTTSAAKAKDKVE